MIIKNIFLILTLSLVTIHVSGQNYFNRLFEDFDYSPNPTSLFDISGDTISIGVLARVNGLRSSVIVQYNEKTDEVFYFDIEGYSLNVNNIWPIGEKYYLFGNDNFVSNDSMVLLKLSKKFEIEEKTYYTNEGSFNVLFGTTLDNYICGVSSSNFDGGSHKEANVRKMDTLGRDIWNKNFSSDIKLNAHWQIIPSLDGKLFFSADIVYYNKLGRYGQVIKMDTSGQVLWTYEGEEAFDNGNVKTWIVELSDSTIVQHYEIFGSQAVEIVLQWIDKDGKPLFKRVYESPGIDEFHFQGMEAGRHGDYFFAYGNYREFDSVLNESIRNALITKYDNNGDTIWTHRYRHPEYLENLDFNEVVDIVEMENGDIVAMGIVLRLGEAIRVWLFKIDSDGCFNPNRCEEAIFFTDTDDMIISEGIKIYPNPSNHLIHIEIPEKQIEGRLQIRSINGQLLMSMNIDFYQDMEVDVSALATGMYFIFITTDKGVHYIKKLLID